MGGAEIAVALEPPWAALKLMWRWNQCASTLLKGPTCQFPQRIYVLLQVVVLREGIASKLCQCFHRKQLYRGPLPKSFRVCSQPLPTQGFLILY